MKSILLIGGTGIISNQISAALIKNGWDVSILNRGKRKERIPQEANLIVADVFAESAEKIRTKLKGKNFDVVIDFLSYSIVHLRKKLLFVTGKCTHFVFISSATVYNNVDNTTNRYTEDSSTADVNWKYATDKTECEDYLRHHAHEYSLNYTIIRPYITYDETRIPLQVTSKQFYTMINRMVCGKAMPLFRENVYTTLTSSKDFAIAISSVLSNEDAYGEAYHITGNCELTWKEVLIDVAAAFDVEADVACLTDDSLNNKKLGRGLDISEYLYKGSSMLFDNTKIKALSPKFAGNLQFRDELAGIVLHFSNPKNKVISYQWDARMDNILAHTKGVTKEQKKKLRISAYKHELTKKEKWAYLSNRYDIIYSLYGFYNRLKKKFKK